MTIEAKPINFLAANNFKLNLEDCPTVSDFAQTISVPGISLPSVPQPTPFSDINIPGDKIQFETLTVDFKLDDQLKGYSEINDWMIALGFPNSHEDYTNRFGRPPTLAKRTKQATVAILNNLRRPLGTFIYEDCHPVYLSGFMLQTDIEGIQYISAKVDFNYTRRFYRAAT